MKGGGYYYDVTRPTIGGKLPLSTYTKQCPPVFCGELMNGGNKKSMRKDTSYIDSINTLNTMSNRITKHKLSEIIGTATLDNRKNMESLNFHRYFNKPTMRVISSIAIMNLLNGVKLSNHQDRVKHISQIMKTNSSNILQLGGSSVQLTSLNYLLNKLHSSNQIGGGEKLNKTIDQLKMLVKPLYNMLNNVIEF
tara:strand:- start:845 stop:1426 length:582 start_codon:yes stop_codon:yes gene_type:complete